MEGLEGCNHCPSVFLLSLRERLGLSHVPWLLEGENADGVIEIHCPEHFIVPGAVPIWGQSFSGGGFPVYYRMLNCILGFHPLDAGSPLLPPLQSGRTKMSLDLAKVSPGDRISPLLRTPGVDGWGTGPGQWWLGCAGQCQDGRMGWVGCWRECEGWESQAWTSQGSKTTSLRGMSFSGVGNQFHRQ